MATVITVPYKKLSDDEIDRALSEPSRQRDDDLIVDPILLEAGPLYAHLWVLSCTASVLAREHLESQPNAEELLKTLPRLGTETIKKTILTFGSEIDEAEDITPKVSRNVVQVLFERVVDAVNEHLRGESS